MQCVYCTILFVYFQSPAINRLLAQQMSERGFDQNPQIQMQILACVCYRYLEERRGYLLPVGA